MRFAYAFFPTAHSQLLIAFGLASRHAPCHRRCGDRGTGQMLKALLLALAAVGLAGCVTAKNTLSLDDVATLRLAGVDVSFAPNAHIWWGDGERAFAASKGQSVLESENLA